MGGGEPVAEQLILTGSSTPDILTASGGVMVKTGGSEWRPYFRPVSSKNCTSTKTKANHQLVACRRKNREVLPTPPDTA